MERAWPLMTRVTTPILDCPPLNFFYMREITFYPIQAIDILDFLSNPTDGPYYFEILKKIVSPGTYYIKISNLC